MALVNENKSRAKRSRQEALAVRLEGATKNNRKFPGSPSPARGNDLYRTKNRKRKVDTSVNCVEDGYTNTVYEGNTLSDVHLMHDPISISSPPKRGRSKKSAQAKRLADLNLSPDSNIKVKIDKRLPEEKPVYATGANDLDDVPISTGDGDALATTQGLPKHGDLVLVTWEGQGTYRCIVSHFPRANHSENQDATSNNASDSMTSEFTVRSADKSFDGEYDLSPTEDTWSFVSARCTSTSMQRRSKGVACSKLLNK